ncbi:MAG TPA: metallophosphoesterase [Blastocatellia bacterium]|nr:metallophosphoesterase [Blastocatellia bacterium]
MRVFAIGDLHLEGGTGKRMDRFGENWVDHDRKIFESWERVGDEDDLLLLVGDITWAMRFEEARPDLERIGRMKGLKLMLKGNHDYWWQTVSKMRKALPPSIKLIHASAFIKDRIAIAGTRGWLCPNDDYFKEEEDGPIYLREVGRLRVALQSLEGRRDEYDKLIVAMHYPPMNDKHETSGFTELIDEARADICVFGHVHGEAIRRTFTGARNSTEYFLASADAIDFSPARIDTKLSGRKE